MELFQASRQWANRPSDERFSNLEDMLVACRGYHENAVSSNFTLQNTQVISQGNEVILQGSSGAQSRLTHYAFGQLSNVVGAPPNYLRSLPTDLVATNLNYGFQHIEGKEKPLKGLFHKNGSLICHCVTSQQYSRIWNDEIIERLIPLADDGWKVPPAMSDSYQPSGLYASDHDMFTFLVDSNHRIDDGSKDGLGRGFFCINSEVGQSSFKLITFYYRYICGNHIVWGAENVQQIRIIHKGKPAHNWANALRIELTKYANDSVSSDQLKIENAKHLDLGGTKEEVLDYLFAKRNLGIGKKDLESSYAIAETNYDLEPNSNGNPNTVWGMVNGITQHSQSKPFADERTKLDMAAGKILEMAF
jgi:hypothetical protein